MKKELSYLETIKMIDETKKIFETQIEKRLGLIKVGSPLFVKKSSGLQDDLSGKEEAVSFYKGEEKFEIVHSLAKWKREALGKYQFPKYTGLYTDMKAIRKDETVDETHSLYVEQWDWEKVIDKSDRTIDYLKETVKSIYKSRLSLSHILTIPSKILSSCLALSSPLMLLIYSLFSGVPIRLPSTIYLFIKISISFFSDFRFCYFKCNLSYKVKYHYCKGYSYYGNQIV